MSSNDGLLIKQKRKKLWMVFHYDADGCYSHILGEFETLEKAADFANKWQDEQPIPVEYGLRIITNQRSRKQSERPFTSLDPQRPLRSQNLKK